MLLMGCHTSVRVFFLICASCCFDIRFSIMRALIDSGSRVVSHCGQTFLYAQLLSVVTQATTDTSKEN